jgi:hypothetical protein
MNYKIIESVKVLPSGKHGYAVIFKDLTHFDIKYAKNKEDMERMRGMCNIPHDLVRKAIIINDILYIKDKEDKNSTLSV